MLTDWANSQAPSKILARVKSWLVFHNQEGIHIVPLQSKVRRSVGLSLPAPSQQKNSPLIDCKAIIEESTFGFIAVFSMYCKSSCINFSLFLLNAGHFSLSLKSEIFVTSSFKTYRVAQILLISHLTPIKIRFCFGFSGEFKFNYFVTERKKGNHNKSSIIKPSC